MNRIIKKIINKLNLKKHSEGGYFSEVYRAKEIIKKNSLPKRFIGNRNISTSIYFLLCDNEFSAFHKLKADEVWHFYSGSPLNIYIIQKNGKLKKIILGEKYNYQLVIEKEQWFAAEVSEDNSYSLVGCTVAPGFDFRDFTLGDRNKLIKLFPKHKKLIERLTRINI